MNLIERVKNIIVDPKKEWDVINTETPNPPAILTGYVIPLLAVGAIASFIGYALIGQRVLGIAIKSTEIGLQYAIAAFVGGILVVYVTAFIVDALAPTFKSEKNFGKSFQIAAYSFTPGWVGAVLNIFPMIAWLGALFGLYGLYVMYVGLPKLKKTPADQQTGYFVVTLVVMIVIWFVIALIMMKILGSILGVNMYSGSIRI